MVDMAVADDDGFYRSLTYLYIIIFILLIQIVIEEINCRLCAFAAHQGVEDQPRLAGIYKGDVCHIVTAHLEDGHFVVYPEYAVQMVVAAVVPKAGMDSVVPVVLFFQEVVFSLAPDYYFFILVFVIIVFVYNTILVTRIIGSIHFFKRSVAQQDILRFIAFNSEIGGHRLAASRVIADKCFLFHDMLFLVVYVITDYFTATFRTVLPTRTI